MGDGGTKWAGAIICLVGFGEAISATHMRDPRLWLGGFGILFGVCMWIADD